MKVWNGVGKLSERERESARERERDTERERESKFRPTEAETNRRRAVFV
jgi:hypothetical protein